MNPREYILAKQIQWAKNNGLDLVGSKGDRGRKAYVNNLNDNFFLNLKPQVIESFEAGDGGELSGEVAKMQALHSSAALAVNMFQYWQDKGMLSQLLTECDLCSSRREVKGSLEFEKKFEIDKNFSIDPNIDIVIKNEARDDITHYAIESKFSEPFTKYNNKKGLKPKYLELDVWSDIPAIHDLAVKISPNDLKFDYLHGAQLIKHILGLKNQLGKSKFRLLYLYYDTPGISSYIHQKEIEEFEEAASADNIMFHSLSYQTLIVRLAKIFREDHPEYIEYITDRYL